MPSSGEKSPIPLPYKTHDEDKDPISTPEDHKDQQTVSEVFYPRKVKMESKAIQTDDPSDVEAAPDKILTPKIDNDVNQKIDDVTPSSDHVIVEEPDSPQSLIAGLSAATCDEDRVLVEEIDSKELDASPKDEDPATISSTTYINLKPTHKTAEEENHDEDPMIEDQYKDQAPDFCDLSKDEVFFLSALLLSLFALFFLLSQYIKLMRFRVLASHLIFRLLIFFQTFILASRSFCNSFKFFIKNFFFN